MIEDEIWKPVVGAENAYEVSNMGNVRSKDRVLTRPKELFDGSVVQVSVRVRGRLLRPGKSASGHVSVSIGRNNSRLVHQLVLEAFVGPKIVGHEVLHINHVPNDNRLENLKYGTRSENLKMDYAAGKRTTSVVWVYSQNKKRTKHFTEYLND